MRRKPQDRDFAILGGFVVRDFRTIIQVQRRTHFPALRVQLPASPTGSTPVEIDAQIFTEEEDSFNAPR